MQHVFNLEREEMRITTTAHSTSDLSTKHQTSEMSLKTSDLIIKHQKWEHYCPPQKKPGKASQRGLYGLNQAVFGCLQQKCTGSGFQDSSQQDSAHFQQNNRNRITVSFKFPDQGFQISVFWDLTPTQS